MASTSVVNEITNIFRRASGCVACSSTPPTCDGKVCPSGQTCTLSVQTCGQCAEIECIALTTTPSVGDSSLTTAKKQSGAPVGAIVGGVLAFLVAVCVAAFFIVRRSKKKNREAYEASVAAWAPEKTGNSSYRDVRASTHTVGSVASSTWTRASNVIQIAYIPGVTNISNPNSPGHLVPPVPPIPGNHLATGPSGEQQFFSADDILRQSVWSTHSGVSLSADPRASVATTIYQKNAIVSPLAATATVVRAKVAVVQVKNSPAPSSGGSSPRTTTAGDTPPVPDIDLSRFPSPKPSDGLLSPSSSQKAPLSPAFSVGSTFLNKSTAVNTVTITKPSPSTSTSAIPPKSTKRTSRISTRSHDDASPFSDRASIDGDTIGPLRNDNHAPGGTSPARFMEGDIRMSFRPVSEVSSEAESEDHHATERGKSPFGDEHRVDP